MYLAFILTWPIVLHVQHMCGVLGVLHVYKYACSTCVPDTCVIHMLYTYNTCVEYTTV